MIEIENIRYLYLKNKLMWFTSVGQDRLLSFLFVYTSCVLHLANWWQVSTCRYMQSVLSVLVFGFPDWWCTQTEGRKPPHEFCHPPKNYLQKQTNKQNNVQSRSFYLNYFPDISLQGLSPATKMNALLNITFKYDSKLKISNIITKIKDSDTVVNV